MIILFILLLSFSSAIEVDFSCPSEVGVGEEFECSVELLEGEGVYDLKFDLSVDGSSVARVWDGDSWGSCYYYLKEFISSGDVKSVKLKIEKAGEIEGVLKFRQGSAREFFDFEILVGGGVVVPGEDVASDEDKVVEDEGNGIIEGGEEVVEEIVEVKEINLQEEAAGVINLNSPEEEEEVIYESKNQVIKTWAIYGFVLFLILVIFVLLLRP